MKRFSLLLILCGLCATPALCQSALMNRVVGSLQGYMAEVTYIEDYRAHEGSLSEVRMSTRPYETFNRQTREWELLGERTDSIYYGVIEGLFKTLAETCDQSYVLSSKKRSCTREYTVANDCSSRSLSPLNMFPKSNCPWSHARLFVDGLNSSLCSMSIVVSDIDPTDTLAEARSLSLASISEKLDNISTRKVEQEYKNPQSGGKAVTYATCYEFPPKKLTAESVWALLKEYIAQRVDCRIMRYPGNEFHISDDQLQGILLPDDGVALITHTEGGFGYIPKEWFNF